MDDLHAVPIRLEWDRARGSYILPEDGWAVPLLSLKVRDVMALALARGLLASPTLPHANAVREAFEKVTAGLSPGLLKMLDAQAAAVRVTGMARDYSHAPVAPLLGAIFGREQVEIDYDSRRSHERSWRRVDPYGLEDREGTYLELHGWCHRRQRVLTFALDRILGVRFTGERFEVNEGEWKSFVGQVGVVGGLRGGPETYVHVRFDPEVGPFARDLRWPAGLRAITQPDGCVELTGTVQGTDGMVRELLRWRRHAHVLGGRELLAAMQDEVKAMAGLYGIV
jgi:predicted DNA-binding transcriptional regulator YafY